VVGVLRLAVSGGDASGEFPTNAAVTVLFLPLASLVILTLVALPVLWVLLRLRALASVIVTLPVLALVGCNGGTPIDGGEPDPATVEAGRQIYMNNGCANCHGEDGSGRGSISAGFDPPPRDYRDPAAYRVGADAESVAATIGTGLPNPGGGMPSFGHLSPERRLQLAGYIVSLQRSDSTEVAVRYAWIGEPLPGTDVTGAWLTIVNRGAADAVVGVEVKGVRRSSLHVTMDLDGMMTMQGLDRLELPASAEVELASGGTHVMLEKIDVALTVGDMAEVTLFLASKTAVRFEALVRAREGAR
jgi:copper(I)-binding protein